MLLYLEFLKIPVKTDSNKYLDTLQKSSTNTNFDTVIFPIYIYIRFWPSVRPSYPEHKLLTEIFLTTCHNRLHDAQSAALTESPTLGSGFRQYSA